MSIFNWFKKKTPDEAQAEPPPQAPTAPKPVAPQAPLGGGPQMPPVTTRTIRTVMPNTVKPVSLRDSGSKPGAAPSARPSLVPKPTISMPGMAPSAPAPQMETAAVAEAPAPSPEMAERTITLELGDFLDRIPGNFLKQGPFDLKKQIHFKATDLYSDLAKGRASVPASKVAELVPEIFSKPITETEDIEINLPLQKLVEQIGDFRPRSDQIAEEHVAEIETPFLQVAKEDQQKFPTAPVKPAVAAPSPISSTPVPTMKPPVAAPPVAPPPPPAITPKLSPHIATAQAPAAQPATPAAPVAPPTQRTVAPIIPGKRPPATVRASVSGGKIRLSGPAIPARISPASPEAMTPGMPAAPANEPITPQAPVGTPVTSLRPSPVKPGPVTPLAAPTVPPATPKQEKKVTARIQIPGINLKKAEQAVAPAPSIPSPVIPPPPPPVVAPAPVLPAAPPTEPRVIAAPPVTPPPAPPVQMTKPIAAPFPGPTAGQGALISLNLLAILKALPGDAVSGDLGRIHDDTRVTFPFDLIESQLPMGRVTVPAKMFVEALPAELQRIFQGVDPDAEVPIPLQEVFQNLPMDALKMRSDQIVEEITDVIATPFSQKAKEDEARFKEEAEEPAAPVQAEAPAPEAEPVAPPPPAPAPLAPPPPFAAPQIPTPVAMPTIPPPPVMQPPAEIRMTPPPVAEAPAEPRLAAPPPTFTVPSPEAVTPVEPEPEPEPVVPIAQPPVSLPTVPPPPLHTAAQEAAPSGPSKSFDTSILQAIFMTEENMDAKSIVRLTSELPGINACLVMFGDGLNLAGNFPAEYDASGICAMAPLMFKKIDTYAQDLKLGGVQTFTIFSEKSPISFFKHENLCLSVLHGARGFLPGIREKLVEITRELSKMYCESNGA